MKAASRAPQTHHVIADANHYYFGQPEKSREAAALATRWIESL